MKRPNQNTNCLQNMCCPQCGWIGDFIIWATSAFHVTDNGSEHQGDLEWTEDNHCACGKCAFEGPVKDFQSRVVIVAWYGNGEMPSVHGPFRSESEARQYAAQQEMENWDIEPLQSPTS